ncbi:MAG TPA: ionic transporter y4hA [Burkholderiales bacterium]|nr:ionic transporter y4hA [Burkholderiales bacterium]
MKKLRWALVAPIAACIILALAWQRSLGWLLLAIVTAALIAAVFAAVHHAEIVAHRVGEPFGTLILALAITVIEVALIVSMMLSDGPVVPELARDTLFATVMIVCNGVVGLCLLVGSWRHHVLEFRVEGTSPALAVLIALSAMTLVLPSLTVTTPGPEYSTSQLIFAGVMSFALYAVFTFVQTVRHRDYFLAVGAASEEHAPPPSGAAALISLALLVLSLIAVVGLAKMLSPGIRAAVDAASAPPAVVGVIIALLVLLPETFAAVRAALRNRMQTSLNLALGSALASIGLTIPAVAAVAILSGLPLALGLDAKGTALLAITLLISTTTLATGRATVLQGAVHLVLFAAFLFLSIVP